MTSGAERPESERYRDAQALAGLQPPELYEAVRVLLGDRAWRVRRAAWEALLAADVEPAARTTFLIDRLEDTEDAGVRGAALEALIALGDRAVPGLVAALGTGDHRAKRYVLDALGRIRSPLAAASALGYFAHEDENVAFAAAEVVGAGGGKAEAAELLERLADVAGTRRFAGLVAVSNIARRHRIDIAPDQVETYLSDPILRPAAIELLGLAGSEGTGELLWELIAPGRQIDAVLLALHNILLRQRDFQVAADVERVAAIIERCRVAGVSIEVRRAAFEVVERVSPSGLAPLVALLAEYDHVWLADRLSGFSLPALRSLIPAVLVSDKGRLVAARLYRDRPQLEGESALLALLSRPGEHVAEVLDALGAMGTLRSAPHLVAVCLKEDGEVAQRATEALLRMVGRDVQGLEGILLGAAESAQPEALVRLLPAIGLLKTGQPVLRLLAMAMRSPHRLVRRSAIFAVETLADDEEIQDLLRARLSDEDEEVRAAAAEVSGRAGAAAGADALRILLDDPSPWVQAAALSALGALGAVPDGGRLAGLLERGGVTGVMAAHLVGVHRREADFDAWAGLVAELDDDTSSELLKSLAGYESDLAPEVIERLLLHPGWPVRAAAAQYMAAKRRGWMVELASRGLTDETDDLVRMRLMELTEGS